MDRGVLVMSDKFKEMLKEYLSDNLDISIDSSSEPKWYSTPPHSIVTVTVSFDGTPIAEHSTELYLPEHNHEEDY